MSDYKDIFRTKGSQNWCKAWTAVHILRDGLKDWVSDEMQNYLASILPAGPVCTTCTTPNTLRCPTPSICQTRKHGFCTYHNTLAKQYRPCAVHNNIRDAIIKEHRFPNPSWMNTQAENWTTSSWEIAKCFMPVGGYLDKLTADDTDFNGIVSPVINCKRFQNLMTANMSDPKNNICAEVRNKVNEIRHFKNMEPTISDVDLTNYLDLFIDLLNDAKSLQNDPRAIDARDKLNKLKTDSLVITTKDIERILQDALSELKIMQDDFHTTMNSTIRDALTKIQDTLDAAMKNCIELIKDAGSQERKQIEDSGSKERKQIEVSGSDKRKEIEDSGSKERKQIEDSGSQERNQIEDSGSKERNQIEDSGSQERNQIEDSGSKERNQIGDSGSQEKNQIEDSGSKERKQIEDLGSHERKQIEDSGSHERKQIKDSGSHERNQIEDSGSKERKQIEDSGSKERKQIEDTGSKEQKRIENSGSKKRKQIEDKSSQEREQIKDTGFQEIMQIEDAGSKERKQIEDTGSNEKKRIEDSGSKKRKQIEDKGSQERKQIEYTGFQERMQIEDSGSKERNQIEDSGSQERKQIEDSGSQERMQIEDSGSQERKQIEDSGSQERKRIEDTVREKLNILNTQTECEFHSKKEALKKDLVEFYQERHSTLPLSPLIPDRDAALDKFYVMPQLQEICIGPETRSQSEKNPQQNRKELQFYGEMFIGDKQQPVRNIYVQGEPGHGKSSFCKKLVMDWCNHLKETTSSEDSEDSIESSTKLSLATRDFVSDTGTSESDTDSTGWSDSDIDSSDLDQEIESRANLLNQFDFLFLIYLRDARGVECDIDEMILNQIVLELAAGEETYTRDFIKKLISSERCLIILDGLDEWIHPSRESATCRRPGSSWHIPHRKMRKNCTILTTTRPWKMAEVRLRDSEIEKSVELTGITDSQKLISNVLKYLNVRYNKAKQREQFVRQMQEADLDHFMDIPVIIMQLLCLWHQDKPFGTSRCEIYNNMIDMMMQISRDKSDEGRISTGQILKLEQLGGKLIPRISNNSKVYTEMIESIHKLAFNTLLSDDKASSIVFSESIVQENMSNNTETAALEAGILSKQQSRHELTDRPTTYCFIHKTFQEFLAALYISQHENDEEITKRLTRNISPETIPSISDIFIFVCGLNPQLAEQYSETIMNMHADQKYDDKYIGMTITIQSLIVNGYNESLDNRHQDVSLSLRCAVFGAFSIPMQSDINTLLQMDRNRRTIHTLIVYDGSDFCVKLIGPKIKVLIVDNALNSQYMDYMDLSECSELQLIELGAGLSIVSLGFVIRLKVKINTSSLEYCKMKGMDSGSTDVILSALAGGAAKLKSLEIFVCDVPEHILQRFSDICLHVTTLTLERLNLNGDLDLSGCQQLRHLNIILVSVRNIKLNASCLQTCKICGRSKVEHDVLTQAAGAPVLTDLHIMNGYHPTLLCQTLPYLPALQTLHIHGYHRDTEHDTGLYTAPQELIQLHTSLPDSIQDIVVELVTMKDEHVIQIIERILQYENSVKFTFGHHRKRCHGIRDYLQKSDRFRLVRKTTGFYLFESLCDNEPKQVEINIWRTLYMRVCDT